MAKPLYKNAAFWIVLVVLALMIAGFAYESYRAYKRVKALEQQEPVEKQNGYPEKTKGDQAMPPDRLRSA